MGASIDPIQARRQCKLRSFAIVSDPRTIAVNNTSATIASVKRVDSLMLRSSLRRPPEKSVNFDATIWTMCIDLADNSDAEGGVM